MIINWDLRIYKYQPNTDSFELYLFLGEYIEGEIILNKIFSDENGTLWFGLSRGLYSKKSDGALCCVLEDNYINDIACLCDSLFVDSMFV